MANSLVNEEKLWGGEKLMGQGQTKWNGCKTSAQLAEQQTFWDGGKIFLAMWPKKNLGWETILRVLAMLHFWMEKRP